MKRILFALLLIGSVSYGQDFFSPLLWKLSGTSLTPIGASWKVPLNYLEPPDSSIYATRYYVNNQSIKKIKTINETVNNTGTFQRDDHLTFTVRENTSYIIDCIFIVTTTATVCWKALFIAPVGATLGATLIRNISSWSAFGSGGYIEQLNTPFEIGSPAFTGTAYYHLSGIFTAGSGGTFALEWAQAFPAVANTTLQKGSYITLSEVQ